MGIYRWAWRSGMGVLTATGAVFAVRSAPGWCARVGGVRGHPGGGDRRGHPLGGVDERCALRERCRPPRYVRGGGPAHLAWSRCHTRGSAAGHAVAERRPRRRTVHRSVTSSCARGGATPTSHCNTRCCPVSGSIWSRPVLRWWRSSPTATPRRSPAGSTAPPPPATRPCCVAYRPAPRLATNSHDRPAAHARKVHLTMNPTPHPGNVSALPHPTRPVPGQRERS